MRNMSSLNVSNNSNLRPSLSAPSSFATIRRMPLNPTISDSQPNSIINENYQDPYAADPVYMIPNVS